MPELRARVPHQEVGAERSRVDESNEGIQLLPDQALAATKAALEDWHRDEIKTTPAQHREFGRFLFTVSVGSVGVLLTIANLARKDFDAGMATILAFAAASWLTSAWASINLAKPTVVTVDLGERLNLSKEHRKDGEKFRESWFIWFVSYCFGWGLALIFLLMLLWAVPAAR